jgi:flavin reductase (DIM6/NTAB) family NADH-FMN oxidoreductase RutF
MEKKKLGPQTLLFPMPAVLVGANVDERPNFMTAAWCGIAASKPPAISVGLDKYTIVELDRTRTVYNWLQYFSPEDIEREFKSSGFSVKRLYSDVAGTPYDHKTDEFAVIANVA